MVARLEHVADARFAAHRHARAHQGVHIAIDGTDGDLQLARELGGRRHRPRPARLHAESLRPLYDRLAAAATALGPDVEFAPKKANVSVRRSRQFALIQPSTRTRVDVGLVLTREAQGRLETSGSFHSMFTHRIRLENPADVDAEVIGWLKEAYDAAG